MGFYKIAERKIDKQVLCFVRVNKDNGGVQWASLQAGSTLYTLSFYSEAQQNYFSNHQDNLSLLTGNIFWRKWFIS